jgi:hypothetical protein
MTDRLSLTNALAEANIDRQKAERIATEIFDAIHDNVATKQDLERAEAALGAQIAAVRADLDLAKHQLMIRLGGLIGRPREPALSRPCDRLAVGDRPASRVEPRTVRRWLQAGTAPDWVGERFAALARPSRPGSDMAARRMDTRTTTQNQRAAPRRSTRQKQELGQYLWPDPKRKRPVAAACRDFRAALTMIVPTKGIMDTIDDASRRIDIA